MDTVITSFGKVCVKKIGQGYPIIVINGGPGLSFHYMEDIFLQLIENNNLNIEFIFFNQIGIDYTKANFQITANSSVKLFTELIEKLGFEEYDILAHSWGAYLIYASIYDNLLTRLPNKILLLNPVPMDKVNYDLVGTKLVNRIPKNDLEKIIELTNINTLESGAELMSIALPYYSGRTKNLPNIKFEYNIDNYNNIANSLDNFDFTNSLKEKLEKFIFILGEDDYIQQSDFKLINNNIFYLKGGHFSFIDDFQGFENIIKKLYV